MVSTFSKHVNGIKRYYKRDGMDGVIYYIKHQIYNNIVKPIIHADLLIPFNPERILARRYEATFPVIDSNTFSQMGNYSIYTDNHFNQNSIIYSLGVLSDTAFDEAISDTFGCSVFLFDPSNIAKQHIEKIKHPKFIFSQIGVWKETCDVEFSTPKYGGSPSMILNWNGKRFTHRCVDLKEILASNDHQHIDLIKMDIEGAAFGVLNRMLELGVYPSQIIAEFERPRSKNVLDYFQFYTDLQDVNNKLKKLGYTAYCMPRVKYKYFSIELIFVRHTQAAS